MAKLQAARGAQYPLVEEFTFGFQNWVVDSTNGVKETFGATVAASTDPAEPMLTGPVANTVVFDAMNIPRGAVVFGGEVIVEQAYVGPTAATLSVGIAGTPNALANAVDLKTAGRTALTLTSPLVMNDGQNIRLTMAYTVANATAGKVRVRVLFTLDGRIHEAITN